MLDIISKLNEAHAYLFIGALIIVLKLSDVISVSWFLIILTLCTPLILGTMIGILLILFGTLEIAKGKKN